MEKISFEAMHLIGLLLPGKTTNENGQAMIDCGNLWQQFIQGNYVEKVQNKISDELLAVYFDYEGDHTKPFAYFIGCKTNPGVSIPEGMAALSIPAGSYEKIVAAGKMPACIGDAWMKIWQSGIDRAYSFDFEVYGEKSRDWNNAVVDIFISVVN